MLLPQRQKNAVMSGTTIPGVSRHHLFVKLCLCYTFASILRHCDDTFVRNIRFFQARVQATGDTATVNGHAGSLKRRGMGDSQVFLCYSPKSYYIMYNTQHGSKCRGPISSSLTLLVLLVALAIICEQKYMRNTPF